MFKYVFESQRHTDTDQDYMRGLGMNEEQIESVLHQAEYYADNVAPKLSAEERQKAKMAGVEFDGVMCSATAEDMWGLKCVEEDIEAGYPVNFKFENGNSLILNQENVGAFRAVWVPFRRLFFPVE